METVVTHADCALGDAGGGESMEVGVSVKDSGMRVITALVPDVRWQSGTADVALRVHGPLTRPAVSGAAHCARASVACPAVLKFPMTGLGANVRFADNAVVVGPPRRWLSSSLTYRCGHLHLCVCVSVYFFLGGGGMVVDVGGA